MYKLITYLEFSQSETTSSTNFGVVSLWLTANNWTQWTSCGSWEQILRLLDTILASTEFASWLIEPGPDESLPPLMVVGIWYHIITLHHLDKVFSTANKKKSWTISKKDQRNNLRHTKCINTRNVKSKQHCDFWKYCIFHYFSVNSSMNFTCNSCNDIRLSYMMHFYSEKLWKSLEKHGKTDTHMSMLAEFQ